jgi:regulator of protease activity HflC (stomatin/prohibitin superfamily)
MMMFIVVIIVIIMAFSKLLSTNQQERWRAFIFATALESWDEHLFLPCSSSFSS